MLHIASVSSGNVRPDIIQCRHCCLPQSFYVSTGSRALLAFPLYYWWWLRSPNNSNNARNVNNNGNLNNNNNVNNNNAVAPGFPLCMTSCLA